MLQRWVKIVDKGGSRVDKLKRIATKTLELFMQAKSSYLILKDIDLRQMALVANAEVQLDGFIASDSWLTNFKKAHRIGSKKITTFVTSKYARDSSDNLEACEAFLEETRPIFDSVSHSNIFNFDQSGFQPELHFGPSLDFIGVRKVVSLVESEVSTSSSYTIMPILSAEGILHPLMYICLKERSGRFGPQVSQSMFRPKNLYIDCSNSGKMEKSHMFTFLKEVLFKMPNVTSFVAICDSWNPFRDR
ncbi:uncharacterized protein LOC129595702 [Paramacrobiotus metropolitanus]|uniref:uncharacterized protein LOC129595702 n=1 Tax=Paramacrobiotus metropolitanus TaxID=2943436 RepID=UPI002445E563|nr:uncharacterized protein LOC129595702 [Paramacrobiotus metropolitanus]